MALLAGAIASGVGGLFNIFQGAKMQREAKKIKPDYYGINDPRLQGMESQYAKDMLGRAQMQVNARMPGAAQRDRQIQAGMAGTQAAVARGAVDPSMAMQAMLASQAQAGQQIDQAAMMDAQFQQQREGQLMNAQQTMISERDKALNEKMNKFQMDMSQKNALRSAGQQAISSGISGIANTITGFGLNQQAQKAAQDQNSLLRQMYGLNQTQPTTQTVVNSIPRLRNIASVSQVTRTASPVVQLQNPVAAPNYSNLFANLPR